MTQIISGSDLSQKIKDDLKIKIDVLKKNKQRLPKLVVMVVGNDSASLSYVRGKEKACNYVGMESQLFHFDENVTQKMLMDQIQEFNQDDKIDGILLQLPLPKHLDEQALLQSIDPNKDVDGFHPINIGKLVLGLDGLVACTPKGIMKMLDSINIKDMSNKHVVIMGRSNIVGKPLFHLLLQKNATITVVHSKTSNKQAICKQADILIVAIGKGKYVTKEYIKPGAVVIDVGINRDENNKLCGDVDFEQVKELCSYISPVPKGVGPMTIAYLLKNTYQAYCFHEQMKEGFE